MTTNAKPANITPADVEFVPASDIAVGDVLVEFTAVGVDVVIPPTQRQLNAKRTAWARVVRITTDVYGKNILNFHGVQGDVTMVAAVTRFGPTRVWRVRPSFSV